MENLVLFDSTNITPKITLALSDHTFHFEGYSLPSNPFEFYKEVILKITQTINERQLNSFAIHIELKYFNTASTKSFHELIKKI
ncbi:MAG: SiaC family regulatory phosphoprotein, partial [Candidatus Fonsibacter sp.]